MLQNAHHQCQGAPSQARHLSANIRSSAKAQHWAAVLSLLRSATASRVDVQLSVYTVGMTACAKGLRWQQVLALLREMPQVSLEPDRISYTCAIAACERCKEWQQALSLLRNLQQENLDTNAIVYSSVMSACEKGGQWQQALLLLTEMRHEKIEADSATVLGSARARKAGSGGGLWRCSVACGRRGWSPMPSSICYNAGISACEKCEQWQRALLQLVEMCEATVEPSASPGQLQRWDQRVCERRAVAAGCVVVQRHVRGKAGAHRHQLQRWDQRVREGRAMAAGLCSAQRDAGGKIRA
ncbi:unnamed protein product [Prorocentrum cordatum]|uniref:Pentatricopeptide repeat-containing protein, chloroplastic n=1 Tax=Prorocentrum cordatum TaxID=2364126 RepID=A0ABN9XLE0_9DINO|nr:unnamed protein product [Polarella glacialis]